MRARSWMAALALIVGTSILIGRGLSAQGLSPTAEKSQNDEPKQARQTETPKPADSRLSLIKLNLIVAGLGQEGCDVEVKPANAGCKFRIPSSQHITSEGKVTFELKEVEIRSADRNFTMAITVREPGQPAKTVYRGFRMTNRSPSTPPSAAASTPTFTCYLSSRLAGVSDTRTRK